MEMFMTPFALFIIASICAGLLAVALPFALWYYFRAKEIAPYLAKKAELEAKLERLQGEIADAKADLEKLATAIAQANDLIAQGDLAKKWLEENQKKIEDVRTQVTAMNGEYELAKQQLDDMKGKVSDKQTELGELNAKLQACEEKLATIEKGHKEVVEKLMSQRDALSKEISSMSADRESLKAETRKVSSQIESLKKERDELEKENKKAKSELAEHEVARRENARLKADNALLQSEHDKLREQIEDGKNKIAQAAVLKKTMDDMWKNLDMPIVTEDKLRKPGAMANENAWLNQFSERLEDKGFIFDERIVRAFHTSLKCALQTPLVVLSGVSGTGKSLLPELYASALGMNFLSVPVQPRWDSPQDLFGFYNYMEGRYKATELARLLWQFDHYNNPEVAKKDSSSLPLNLVLLDEMNLARVEYYFSDLLSKLETRNGLNAAIAHERRKAEVELECNAAGSFNTMRRLFVSPDTLFVGTMNEDESTQTLSDKVIDRANVLRFGRPKMLSENDVSVIQEPNKSAFFDLYAGDRRISASEWGKWCRSLEDVAQNAAALKVLHDVVTPVVEAMDRVNRSYGFRVDKAMKLYVMNYPGDPLEAVADQIEMKILPKLNGVDRQNASFDEARNAISTAISQTKDEKLQQAFDAACKTDEPFFKWRGVMR